MLRTILLSTLAVIACNASAEMAVDFDWRLDHRCSAVSPALDVSDIPGGTAKLLAKMVDRDMTSFVHGGGQVEVPIATANFQIPPGALKSYNGPCPPNFTSFGHDYTWTVQAVDAAGKVIASANRTKTFSSSKVAK